MSRTPLMVDGYHFCGWCFRRWRKGTTENCPFCFPGQETNQNKCRGEPRDCSTTNNHCAHYIQLTAPCCYCNTPHKDFKPDGAQ